jgi:CrcB protein
VSELSAGTGLLVALGAAVGAPLRFVVSSRVGRTWPWGTLTVNVVGSLLLGGFAALAATGALSSGGLALLGTGFCGGFTTFSSFAVQTHDLGDRRGLAYAAATVVLALAAAALGWVLGSAL